MSGPVGFGGGVRDQSGARALAESQVAEAQRHQVHTIPSGRWPGAMTVLRILIGLTASVVLLGWVLTALNGGA